MRKRLSCSSTHADSCHVIHHTQAVFLLPITSRQLSCSRSRPDSFPVVDHVQTVVLLSITSTEFSCSLSHLNSYPVFHQIQIFALFLTTPRQLSCCSSPHPSSCPVLNHIPTSSCAHPACFQRVPTVMRSGCEFYKNVIPYCRC